MKILIPLTGILGIAGVVLGACFKILHLPGADELMLMGLLVSVGVFIPLVLIQRYRKKSTP
jgi:hypothetical protein